MGKILAPCYGESQAEVVGAIDLAHSASPQQRNDAVTSGNQGARKEAAFAARWSRGARWWTARRRRRTARPGR